MYLIGIDLGTTGCKSMLFDYEGRILAQRYIEYGIIKSGDISIEQDANLWWSLVKQSVCGCITGSGIGTAGIKALSISSQGISFVPVDTAGNTLYNAVSWLDTRPVEQTALIDKTIGGKEVFLRTGKRISPNYTLSKLIWMKENMPDVYKRTHKFLMGLDFITFKLTGRTVTDYTMASGTMAFNINNRKWDEDIIEKLGLDIGKLPEVDCAGTPVGDIGPAAALEMGLPPDTKIILGAQDQKCAAVGAGIGKGIVAVSLGTATAVSSVHTRPVLDKGMRVPCYALDDNHWILESVINTSCITLKWLKTTLFENLQYKELDLLAKTAEAGAGGVYFYPHMEGAATPYWRSDIKGSIYGLSLSTTKGDIIRALLEGIGFQIKVNISVHEEINGETVNEIRIFGGGSNSELWCSVIADITGKTVSALYTSEIANLGAAILAGIGTGIYKDYGDVLSKIRLIKKQYIPDADQHRKYCEIFDKYIGIQEKLLS